MVLLRDVRTAHCKRAARAYKAASERASLAELEDGSGEKES